MTIEFRIAASFTAALARLAAQDKKAAKTTAFDLQMDPAAPGLRFHRIERSRDPHFWSVRASGDIRIIIHKTEASFLLAYVGHHDDSYAWAERRRIEAHPRTGAIQIVEVRERVEESAASPALVQATPVHPTPPTLPFLALSPEELLTIGVPPDWVDDVRQATEDAFLALADHLPAEASEALLEYVGTGRLRPPTPAPSPAIPLPILTHCAAFVSWRIRMRWRRRWMRRGINGRSSSIRPREVWWSGAMTDRRGPPVRPVRGRL
jgi:hypothetical protein